MELKYDRVSAAANDNATSPRWRAPVLARPPTFKPHYDDRQQRSLQRERAQRAA